MVSLVFLWYFATTTHCNFKFKLTHPTLQSFCLMLCSQRIPTTGVNHIHPLGLLHFIYSSMGRLGQLFQYMRKYNAESPKQGSKRFNSNAKTKYIADLGIMYLWLYSTVYIAQFRSANVFVLAVLVYSTVYLYVQFRPEDVQFRLENVSLLYTIQFRLENVSLLYTILYSSD